MVLYYLFIYLFLYNKRNIYIFIILIIHKFSPYINSNLEVTYLDQTTPNMIQRISGIFERNALISKEI